MSAPLADQPAFPLSLVPAGQPLPVAEQIIAGRGLTVRQHFAAMAMQGLLSSGVVLGPHNFNEDSLRALRAKVAVMEADALIAALERKK